MPRSDHDDLKGGGSNENITREHIDDAAQKVPKWADLGDPNPKTAQDYADEYHAKQADISTDRIRLGLLAFTLVVLVSALTAWAVSAGAQ